MRQVDPAELAGCFVVEVGVRQAWPFVTFADNADGADPAEVRLDIDSVFTIDPAPPDSGRGDEDDTRLWLLRLEAVLDATVEEARVEPDGSLLITFHEAVRLRVSGHGAPWTTRDVWRLRG